MRLNAGLSETSQTTRQTQINCSGINCFDLSNHEAEFFIYRRPVQNGAHLPAPDEPFMNLNFAFACMIVVSFTIALVHT
jgi:hypothetical protein